MSAFTKIPLLSTILILSMICSAGADVPVVINELLASNGNNLQDPQGQYDDWIELYNDSTNAVVLSGMYLTDDLNEPTKWQFPTPTVIGAEGYLLIWADNDTSDPGLHANFKLSADGEEIGLFDNTGNNLIDAVTFPEQSTDVSYGRYPDAALNWYYLSSPSPESENAVAFLGEVATPLLDHTRGFYEESFSVTISTETDDADIYYSFDGTAPCELNPRGEIQGILYTGPIQIDTTTCLKVQAMKSGWKNSNIETHTYIFLDDVIRQPSNPEGFPTTWGNRMADYAMDQRVVNNPAYSNEIKDDLKSTPSVSIVIPNSDFFGSGGIYANQTQTGDQWERKASVEWIDPNTGDNFSVDAGLRIHGGPYSRSNTSKNALKVIFRSKYGPSKLDFPLFPDTKVESFNSLALRSIWNYSWHGDSHGLGTSHADYLRDAFARDTVRDMGNLTPHGRAIQVYINGLYWGMYIMTERPEEHFAADHLGGDSDDYDVLEAPSGTGASTTMDIVSGGEQARQAWNTLFDLSDNDLSQSQWYESIKAYIDIPTMIDYMLMIYYVGSRDAPVFLGDSYTPRNFYVIRNREPAEPYIIVPWDTEWALEDTSVNRVNVVGVVNPHYLINRLLLNSDFRMLLADHIHKHFFNGGTLTPERTTQRYLDLVDEVYGAIVGESARWGDSLRSTPYTRNVEWNAEVNRLVNQYFSGRTDTVLNQLKQAGFYPSVAAPVFYVNGLYQYGGYVDSTDVISMISPSGNVWYTLDGTDPRQWYSAPEDNTTTLITENADKKVLVPTGNISNNWKGSDTFNDSGWQSCTGNPGGVGFERSSGYQSLISLDVGSQMYGINCSCYIRIPFDLENNPEDLDFMNLNIKYDDGFVAYLNGVEVARRNFSGTPTWNSNANSSHDDSLAVAFENIDISSYLSFLSEGSNILAIQGLNQSPTSSDFLISVELLAGESPDDSNTTEGVWQYINPISLNKSTHIKARTLNGNTWSALNEATYAIGPVAENLRITELMYHPFSIPGANDPNEEFIELTNIGTETINLNLVSFTNGIDFTFPDFELAPGEYIVLVEDPNAFESLYGTQVNIAGQFAGRFANNGERIRLEDALGQTILDFKYSDDWYNSTDGYGYSLTINDPANSDLQSWNNKEAWSPSLSVNGSPGTDE